MRNLEFAYLVQIPNKKLPFLLPVLVRVMLAAEVIKPPHFVLNTMELYLLLT